MIVPLHQRNDSNSFLMRNLNVFVQVRNFTPTSVQNVSVRWTLLFYSLSDDSVESKSLCCMLLNWLLISYHFLISMLSQ